MIEPIGISLAAALGTFAFFGGIALLMWIDAKNKRHERELKHAERIKALEFGQPLPDVEVARAQAEKTKYVFVGLIAFLVPPALLGTAVGATALIFTFADPGIHLALSCVIWGIAGVVSLVAISNSLQVMGGVKDEDEEKKEEEYEAKNSDRIKETPTVMR